MSKEKELFSIGEIAKSIGITRKIILNYETKGLIKPDRKDGSTGNRYYTIDTFTQIRTIRVFQDLGLSLDEIKGYFDDSVDLNPLIQRLETMRDELNLSIEKLRERTAETTDCIKIITVPEQTVYRKKYTSSTVFEKTALLRETALEAMREYGTDVTRRMYFIEYPIENKEEVVYCIAVPPESRGENVAKISDFRAISLYHHGAYETIPDTLRNLIEFAKKNNLKIDGTCRHIYIEGPPQHKNKEKFITQILLPVSK